MNFKTLLRQSLLAALLVVGCATAEQQLLDEPVLEYRGMEMTTNGFFDANPIFNFHIDNPNPLGMTVSEITYSLFVNNHKFVKGVSGQNTRLLAGDNGAVSLSIFFNFLDLYDIASLPRNAETVHYALSGDVRIGPFSVPYQTTGQFDVPRIPDIRLTNARLEKMDAGKTALLLNIRIRNPNPFAITLGGLDYRVRLGEEDGLDGKLNGPVSLEPGTDTPLVLSALPATPPEDASGADRFTGRDLFIALSGEMIFRSEGRAAQRLPFTTSGNHRIEP